MSLLLSFKFCFTRKDPVLDPFTVSLKRHGFSTSAAGVLMFFRNYT